MPRYTVVHPVETRPVGKGLEFEAKNEIIALGAYRMIFPKHSWIVGIAVRKPDGSIFFPLTGRSYNEKFIVEYIQNHAKEMQQSAKTARVVPLTDEEIEKCYLKKGEESQ